ncbi:SDR family oxidoreductase [uncultured Draconibacterium sp.]|uniref:SDR family oxidoreductase n=1 Tax=uncultured Draconibacterium sp. TaxID=1573823 RepID=UPI003260EE7E
MNFKMNKKNIAIAGATGYLGKYLVEELIDQRLNGIALARSPEKLNEYSAENLEKIKTDFTRPQSLQGVLKTVDTLISTVGITRQKDGLSYLDVDYQANINLLEEAQKAGVRKFIYVAVLNGQNMRELRICEAKERFVDRLKISGLEYTIIRPTGFFSDMKDFLEMAQRGSVYLFGKGDKKMNPIHGKDLAKVCFNAVNSNQTEVLVGGPEVFTHRQIAEMALKAAGKKPKIIRLPDFLRKAIIALARTFFTEKTFGPVEFFLTAMAFDMVAPKFGTHKLIHFFAVSAKNTRQHKNKKNELT